MSKLEQKSLIDDLLNTIPVDIQTNLHNAINQLTNFLSDSTQNGDCIPAMITVPNHITDIFHRFATIDLQMENYGPYNREQLIHIDLAINPQRFSSWQTLLTIKIKRFHRNFDANDLTQ